MTTLDIFANNIIGGNNSVSDFSGENANRWLQINAPSGSGSFANFFIVKKLSPSDSQSVSSAIDSTSGIRSKLTFDNNGNIKAPVLVQNPLTTQEISPVENDNKQFSEPNSPGYCASRDIIFSSNLKWILYRNKNDSNQMYILYNPMHRQNVKDYYNSVSANNPYGEDGGFMQTLIQKYRNVFTITPLNEQTKTKAIFAEPSCACYDQHNCNNDYANFYISPESSNQLGWSCACGGAKSCSYAKTNNGDSFLNQFQNNVKPSQCPTQVSFCNIDFTSAGNINAKDLNIKQNCPFAQTTFNTTNPQTTIDTPTPSPTPISSSSISTPLIVGGGSVIIIIAIIIAIFIFKK